MSPFQEKVERLDMGTIPRNMTAVLEYDLVDTCKAGDDVTIFGIVTQIWDTPVINTRCTVETVLHANYIQVNLLACEPLPNNRKKIV